MCKRHHEKIKPVVFGVILIEKENEVRIKLFFHLLLAFNDKRAREMFSSVHLHFIAK